MSIGEEKAISAIEEYATPLLESMGIELVETQFRREGHGWVLRLYIDREEGVTLDDCAVVSREISTWLDVEDLIEHAFHLEVSSPGLERPLKRVEEFKRFAGRKARIKIREAMNEQKVFIGIIDQVNDEEVMLNVDGKLESFSFENIAKARLIL